MALAVLCNSPDSLIKNIYYKKTALWLTGSIKPGINNKNCQILLGLNLAHELKSQEADEPNAFNKLSMSVPIRVYVGSNKYKGFVEMQYSFETFLYSNNWRTQSNALLNFGMEVNAIDGIWIQANAGWNNEILMKGGAQSSADRKSEFVYRIDFRFNLPENFKLF